MIGGFVAALCRLFDWHNSNTSCICLPWNVKAPNIIDRFLTLIGRLIARRRINKIFRSGAASNPLKNRRNIRCLCGSGLKAKRCCGQINVLPRDVAMAVKRALPAKR